jgi:hypothetical protein
MRLEAVAHRDRVHGEEQHLHQYEGALDCTVIAEAVRVQRGRQPDEPHGGEGAVDRADSAEVRGEADRVAERDDGGGEHEVVEQLEPGDGPVRAHGGAVVGLHLVPSDLRTAFD